MVSTNPPMSGTRFACPTSGLALDQLAQRGRRAFWSALVLAVLAHVAVVGVDPFRPALDKTPRPLTTRLIKRQPRLTKPLELRKIPKPRRQLLQRQVRLLSARMDQVRDAATFSTRGVLHQVTAVDASADHPVRSASLSLEPALATELIRGARQPASKIDLSLEMLDIEAMDSGRYRAMVIQDPEDGQSLKGFVQVARVISARRSGGMYQNLAIDGLVDNLNRYTGIQARFVDKIFFDDIRLLEVPFVIYYQIGQLTDRELLSVGRYLKEGGFILGRTDWAEALEKYGGLVGGRDYHYDRVPDDHPIFRSFFDMGASGVPLSSAGGHTQHKQAVAVTSTLSGLWIGDRLAAIEGVDVGAFGHYVRLGVDTTRHLQLGVNILVYALTQEGSITHRLMQMVE